jgi:hypothetical protein
MWAAFMTVVPATSGLSVKALGLTAKVAVTARAALMVTLQVPVPVQLPLQPEKVEPAAGAAVKVTAVPLVKDAEQVALQSMPAGALVTVPVPAPALVTVRAKDGKAKVAVTARAALMVTLQVPVPVQLPLQPVKVEPAAGAAVRVTAVPLVKEAEQVAPHEMPAGALVTVPVPFPDLVTERAKVGAVNVAVTLWATLMVTVQVPVPVQPPPLQPVKVEPAAGAAVRVTIVPIENEAEQVVPQEMPAGLLVTVPPPLPDLETVNVEAFDTPVPVTSRDTVSPSAVKAAFVLASAVPVGVKRTVTLAVAPLPMRVKGLPETMLNGAGTEAVPVTVPVRVLCTVKVWVAELPMLTLPKFTVPVGVTATSTAATALATAEQALSLPLISIAVTATL